MVKNHDIRVRVSKNQLDQIKDISKLLGFGSVSDFIRDSTLGKGLSESRPLREAVGSIVHKVMAEYRTGTNKNPILYDALTCVPYKVQKEPGYDPFYEDALKYLKGRYR